MKDKYDVIIGLEIHTGLKTKSKMFCGCDNASEGREANTLVCPICLGHPGTLPVPNKQAIEWTILLGQALHGQISQYSKFDRKNYFYPDLPKGYQISQYDLPLVGKARLEVDSEIIPITRIHLEEDTGKSTHPNGADYTLIDFNRAGTPLVEMVTEPVIKDAETAKKFCQLFQQILRYLNISDANMEKGEMRCEANISVQEKGKWEYVPYEGIKPIAGYKLNPKTELKNLNSFKAVERGINYEIQRQIKAIENKEELLQETRGWNENKNETVRQRVKETSADYRYFPEPDIPPLYITPEWYNEIRRKIIELPVEKKKRFIHEYFIEDRIAELIVSDKHLADYTERVISELEEWINSTGDTWERQKRKLSNTAVNWITSELFKHFKNEGKDIRETKITPENFAEFISLVYLGKVSSTAAQQILEIMFKNGGDPSNIIADLGLEQVDSEEELEKIVKKIIEENPQQKNEYRAGKTPLIQFFIGKVMAKTKGKANPKIVTELLKKLL